MVVVLDPRCFFFFFKYFLSVLSVVAFNWRCSRPRHRHPHHPHHPHHRWCLWSAVWSCGCTAWSDCDCVVWPFPVAAAAAAVGVRRGRVRMSHHRRRADRKWWPRRASTTWCGWRTRWTGASADLPTGLPLRSVSGTAPADIWTAHARSRRPWPNTRSTWPCRKTKKSHYSGSVV